MQYQSSELNQSIRLMQKLRNNTSIPYTMIKEQDSKAKSKKILDHLKQTINIADDELELYRVLEANYTHYTNEILNLYY